MKKTILVTGGFGFIGINFVKLLLKKKYKVINIDKITYASKNNLKLCKNLINKKNFIFYKIDITNEKKILDIVKKHKPNLFFNFAAESHVDNSINSPKKFLKTNILGTYSLLQAIIKSNLDLAKIKFVQISTDEVFGDSKNRKRKSVEADAYVPSSPYAASKASADNLVKAWSRTYGLKYIITYSCNNFGYFQHKEKFIPKIIDSILNNKKIPVYGDGKQKREWIFVEDNIDAIFKLGISRFVNESFNISSNKGIKNINLIKIISKILIKNFGYDKSVLELVSYIKDRPGHDNQYKISNKKINKYLKWYPKIKLEKGLTKTILWNLETR
jgi:dTDP-glucose 4,6-dehydratase